MDVEISDLNDAFRTSFKGGTVVVTSGVAALGLANRLAVLQKVRQFDDFTEENDPYGEHDFGAIEQDQTKYFWKIDAYDPDLKFASADPKNPAITERVLTVMRADEY